MFRPKLARTGLHHRAVIARSREEALALRYVGRGAQLADVVAGVLLHEHRDLFKAAVSCAVEVLNRTSGLSDSASAAASDTPSATTDLAAPGHHVCLIASSHL
jgi:hypothetical protein